MKITNIRTYKMQVPLVRPFRIALGLITHAESCLVEIETDAGGGDKDCRAEQRPARNFRNLAQPSPQEGGNGEQQ